MENKNLIGISGKIFSGKNLTTSIIQYLTNPFDKDLHIKFHKDIDYEIGSEWKQKSFAHKLKKITSLLTGISVEDLEKQEVKNSKLSNAWDNSFGVNTYRQMLQVIGTDLFREQLCPDVWVNALFADYKPKTATIISKDCPKQGIYDVTEEDELKYGSIGNLYPNWIITDMRFPNELEAVKKRGGISIRVNRPAIVVDTPNGKGYLSRQDYNKLNNIQEHESEIALDDATFDYVINNNGNLDELIKQVKQILIKEKIL
jgi:hypothetical protein